MVGPGLRSALGQLGDPGQALTARWSALSQAGLLAEEAMAMQFSAAEAALYDERLPGTRWRAYRRTGLACALLRQAGREARQAPSCRRTAVRQ
jgi:hypothetical protein